MEPSVQKKTGILLVNLGTPDEPTAKKVGVYLREFLMDPDVIDIPKPLRWFLVNVLIVPRRSHASAEAYRKVWTERGSPLKFHSEDLARKVGEKLGPGFAVRLGMRYQNPSIRSVLRDFQAEGIEEVRVLPLYPQYAAASSLSTEKAVTASLAELRYAPKLGFLPAFYDDDGFIESFAIRIREVLARGPFDHILFSFHGLPERQILKTDPNSFCFTRTDCCDRICAQNVRTCYRAHSYETARLLASSLGLPKESWSVSFQSRLGRTKWIEPYTDVVLPELAARGARRIAVVCPAFVADCLETLEEIGIRAGEQFRGAGGEEVALVPSLNSEPAWVDTVARLAKDGGFR